MNEKKFKQSKADIAKRFELPERQSKITSLLSQAGQAYCVCRSSDSSRFMIGCDACEEWYHGDCINISEREARYIKTYFCDKCREDDPTLKTRFKPQKREHELDTTARDTSKLYSGRDENVSKKKRKEKHHSEHGKKKSHGGGGGVRDKRGCGECAGCLRLDNCAQCDACLDMVRYGGSNRLKMRCRQRVCLQLQPKRSSKLSSKKHKSELVYELQESQAHLQTDSPRQCYGPQCTRAALYGSKYCSAQCGLSLATARIYQVLPQRIQEWSLSPCVAEERNRRALERVRSGLSRAQAALRSLDKQHQQVDALVARARNATIQHNPDDKEADDETSMYCITCGHEIHSRTAVRHMEKCFVKHEAQASFGSRHRTRIDAQSMFCDYYNPHTHTYCKRLRVLCPEHSKDPKVTDDEVCGCPLTRDVFQPTTEFCRAPKKLCQRHHVWEKLRRAEIDMERVRQWLQLDELVELERQIRLAMASRAGVLGLMLHSTYNHDVMERITKKQNEPIATVHAVHNTHAAHTPR